MAIKVKKMSPKEFGKAIYKYTGAKQLVDSGKALSKCKPKDAKCIAKNLGNMAMAAKGLTPAGLASTVAKNAIKEQVMKKVEAEKKKKAAKKKLEQAKTEEEKKAAEAEVAAADKTINEANKSIAENDKVVKEGDAEKMVALQQIEQAKLDPATAKQAAQVEQQAKNPDAPVEPIVVAAPEEPKIYGIPQMKFAMMAGGFMFFILLLIILLK